MQLRSGDLAAPAARCLPLLPSGSGGVHRATMRETQSSTPHEPSGAQVIGGPSRPKLLASPEGARSALPKLPARRAPPRPDCPVRSSLLMAQPCRHAAPGWRRGRDSNPGWSFPHTRSPGVLLQPLGHLSGYQQETSLPATVRGTAVTDPRRMWSMVWRRGWDSNPRGSCPPTRFRGGPVTTTSVPLRHPRGCG
jgi:hypothetical protein